nr:hypothetical protein [Tanacetum cinerariifolium]
MWLDDDKDRESLKELFGSSMISFLYQVNLLETLYKEVNTVSLTVRADPTIGLRRESKNMLCGVKWSAARIQWPRTAYRLPLPAIRDTVQLETAVSTISQEYLLKFTSEYGISEALHSELPRPEDWIVDFPEGKQKAWEKYPAVLHQVLRLSKKLEQPLLLGGREGIPNYHGLAHECSKRWDAGQEYVFPRGRESTGHTPYPNPETTRGITLLSGVKPQILPGRRDMDLFNLIRAPNPTKVKTGSRPLYWARRPGNCGPGGAAPEDVPTMRGAPEAGPSERVAVTESPAAKERRKRGHDGVDTNAPPKSRPSADVAQSSKEADVAGDPESENTSFASMVGSPESIYRPEWGIANGSMLDTPQAFQDLVDHVAPPGYFSELQSGNLLEAEADMKKAAEDKSVELSQEMENMCALFLDLQVSNNRLSQQVSTLQEQVSGEEKLKAVFKEFKQYEDNWMIGRGLRLAVMKYDESIELRQAFADVVSAGISKGMCEGLKHEEEHGRANLDLEAIEAYNPEAEAKYIAALQALKNMKYPLVDQLEGLNDAPMDMIMASLHLESDTGDDAPQWVRKLRPKEMLLADAIAANVSRAEKKKKCRVGLAILLADATTQTETSDEASPQLLRSSSLPVIHSRIFIVPHVCLVCSMGVFAHTQRLGHMTLRTQSPRPLGLQPVYAVGRV